MAQVINDKKVTDHHAVIPTRNLQGADLPLAGRRKSGAGAGGPAAAVRRGGTSYLCGNRSDGGVRRSGVYRQGPHGEKSWLAGTGCCPTAPD